MSQALDEMFDKLPGGVTSPPGAIRIQTDGPNAADPQEVYDLLGAFYSKQIKNQPPEPSVSNAKEERSAADPAETTTAPGADSPGPAESEGEGETKAPAGNPEPD